MDSYGKQYVVKMENVDNIGSLILLYYVALKTFQIVIGLGV